jgi:hypothetical protein
MKNRNYTLGIDMGVASIGWSAVAPEAKWRNEGNQITQTKNDHMRGLTPFPYFHSVYSVHTVSKRVVCCCKSCQHRRLYFSFRNRLIHGHDSVDDAIVWDVIQTKLPLLLEEVERCRTERDGLDLRD